MIEYICTHAFKAAEVDDFNSGCVPDTYRQIFSERPDVQAGTLAELIQALGERYGLDIDDIWFPADEMTETETLIGYSRLENEAGGEPRKSTIEKWKRGEVTLYLADYYFRIQRREVYAVTADEFKAASLKYHE
jgi:hypothetical protein